MLRAVSSHKIGPGSQRCHSLVDGAGTAVTNLFHELQGELVNRATVLTAAQQVDSAKRVRDARKQLAPKGIVIFGHYRPHPRMATELGLPVPTLGRFVSARLAPYSPGERDLHTEIADGLWRLARPEDPEVLAPKLPNPTNGDE